MSATATICDCCKEPIEGIAFRDHACKEPVCEECARCLLYAKGLLNKAGMVNLYFGPCGDNKVEGGPL